MLFTVDASGERIFYGGKVDDASHRSPKKSSMVSAMRKFKLLDRQATVEEDGNQDTLHQNAVNGLRLHGGGSALVGRSVASPRRPSMAKSSCGTLTTFPIA